jgi:hypothetical protein
MFKLLAEWARNYLTFGLQNPEKFNIVKTAVL